MHTLFALMYPTLLGWLLKPPMDICPFELAASLAPAHPLPSRPVWLVVKHVNLHSPSGLPSDVMISCVRPLDKVFPSRAVPAVAQAPGIGRIGS